MKRLTFFLFLWLVAQAAIGQSLTGMELLDKAIAYHDPDGNWSTIQADLQVTMSTPGKGDRVSDIHIDLPAELFQLTSLRDSVKISQFIKKDSCQFTLNEKSDISPEDIEKHRLNCERAKMMRNYYTYLYG